MVKSYGANLALAGVDLPVGAGEICAVVGENGAGKSTLVRIAAGVVRPDRGRVRAGAVELAGGVPGAQAAGVHLMHQEPALFPDLEVAENMLLSSPPRRRWPPGIDWRRMRKLAAAQLDRLGADIDPCRRAGTLSVADRQMVDVASALLQRPRVLIVDEPTAALTPVEVERLFGILRRLRDDGVAIVFVGHRLEEVFAIADRITVLRDGRKVADVGARDVGTDQLISLMVGGGWTNEDHVERAPAGAAVLEVDDVDGISLTVRAGEIVGLAGLVGSGRTELAEAIFGVGPRSSGDVRIAGRGPVPPSPDRSIEAGLAYVPEDRARHGVALALSVSDNLTLPLLRTLSRGWWLQPAAERRAAAEAVRRLRVGARSVSQRAGELSGGNQQKVALGKWLAARPKALIVDEPTRGVDVAAKAEIHRILSGLARDGLGILMISSELPELLLLSDRVLVMRDGRLVAELSRAEAEPERVMRLATGQPDLIAESAR